MEKDIIVNDDILLYAFRYSLTRKTDANIKVMNSIIRNLEDISTSNLKKIQDEINSSHLIRCKKTKSLWSQLTEDINIELRIRKEMTPLLS